LGREPTAVATMLWAVCNFQEVAPYLVKALVPLLLEGVEESTHLMTPDNFGITVWALGALARKTRDPSKPDEPTPKQKKDDALVFMNTQIVELTTKAALLPGRDYVLELRGMAKQVDGWAEQWLAKEHVRKVAVRSMGSRKLNLGGLSRAMWGFAALGVRIDAVMTVVDTRMEKQVALLPAAITAKHVPRILWAFATLGYTSKRILQVAAKTICNQEGFLRMSHDDVHAGWWAFDELDVDKEYEWQTNMFYTKILTLIRQRRQVQAAHIIVPGDLPTEERERAAMDIAYEFGRLGPDADMTVKREAWEIQTMETKLLNYKAKIWASTKDKESPIECRRERMVLRHQNF